MHVIAAKAVALKEAMEPEFKVYQQQVAKNAKAMVEVFLNRGYKVVSGGTENHLFLLGLVDKNLTGKEADAALVVPTSPSTKTACRTIRRARL